MKIIFAEHVGFHIASNESMLNLQWPFPKIIINKTCLLSAWGTTPSFKRLLKGKIIWYLRDRIKRRGTKGTRHILGNKINIDQSKSGKSR